jgi:hypothetical protein
MPALTSYKACQLMLVSFNVLAPSRRHDPNRTWGRLSEHGTHIVNSHIMSGHSGDPVPIDTRPAAPAEIQRRAKYGCSSPRVCAQSRRAPYKLGELASDFTCGINVLTYARSYHMLLQRVVKERFPTARDPDRGHACGAAAPGSSADRLSPSLSWSRRVERVWRSTSCALSHVRLRRTFSRYNFLSAAFSSLRLVVRPGDQRPDARLRGVTLRKSRVGKEL